MKSKKNIPLIISAVFGVAYSLYIVSYFVGTLSDTQSGAEAVGTAIAATLVLPHMICVLLAAIFNVIACFTMKRGFALTGAILYSVSAVLFFLYALFVLPSLVLSFVGFAKIPKQK